MNRILIGEYLGNKNFCKPILDKEDFDKIQALLSKHSVFNVKGRSGTFVNIFRGLAYCSECNKRMHITTQTWDYRAKKAYRKRYRYWRCPSHSTGKICRNWQLIDVDQVEYEIFVEFLTQTPEGLLASNDVEANQLKREIGMQEAEKHAIDEQIERLAVVNQNLNLEQFTKQATKLKQESDAVKERLDALGSALRQIQGAPANFNGLKEIVAGPNFDLWTYNDQVLKVQESLKDNEIRKKIRLLLPSLIGRIKCYTQAGGNQNGAFEVLNAQGKVIYECLDLQMNPNDAMETPAPSQS
jgi:hypothetical protein